MAKRFLVVTWGLSLMVALPATGAPAASDVVALPRPVYTGRLTVAHALKVRRTVRSYKSQPLSLTQLSQVLWAGYGITAPPNFKTVPSARRTYPLDLYAVVSTNGVKGLAAGVYHYRPAKHALKRVKAGDLRADVARQARYGSWMTAAPVLIVITAEYARATRPMTARGRTYADLEAGCAAQSIFLMVQDQGLAAGIVGGLKVDALRAKMGLPAGHEPLVVMPVGYRK
jgi:SagB-type dehydrogenase family enzyme